MTLCARPWQTCVFRRGGGVFFGQRSGRANYLNNRPKLVIMPSAKKARAKAQEEGRTLSRETEFKQRHHTQMLSSPLYILLQTNVFLGFQLFCIKTLNAQVSLFFFPRKEKQRTKKERFFLHIIIPLSASSSSFSSSSENNNNERVVGGLCQKRETHAQRAHQKTQPPY